MKKKKIFLLDRNIISLVKNSNRRKVQVDRDKIMMLNRPKKIDRSTSFITPLVSIIEGQTGSSESVEKMKKTIEVEATALAIFFNKAQIDSDFLIKMKNRMSEIFVESDYEYKRKYDSFLSESNGLLIDKQKK